MAHSVEGPMPRRNEQLPTTDTSNNLSLQDGLRKLIGSKLSSVEFVMDYVQLRFDGPTLTAYTTPAVVRNDEKYAWDEPGYRDALCGQIGHLLQEVSVDEQVKLTFDNAASVLISLRDEDYSGAEALYLSLDKTHWWVA
jgi:hypothetical protein